MNTRQVTQVRRRLRQIIKARGRQGHVLRAMAKEPLPRGRQGMVGIGEGAKGQPGFTAFRPLPNHRHGFLGDEVRGMQFLPVGRLVDLPPMLAPVGPGGASVVVVHEAGPIRSLAQRPAQMVPRHARPVIDGQGEALEAVEVLRGRDGIAPVALLVLNFVPAWRKGIAFRTFSPIGHDRIPALPVLEMGFPQERRAITGGAKLADEGVRIPGQRSVVKDHAVRRRQAPGHDGTAIRHAHGIGHPGIAKDPALGRQRIQVRGTQARVPHETDVIGALLIGDDEEHIGPLRHDLRVPLA